MKTSIEQLTTLSHSKNLHSDQLPPPPDMIDINTNKCMWIINDYKIWASSYEEALSLLPLIESF